MGARGRPRKDKAAAEAAALAKDGLTLEDAAAEMSARGKPVSPRTIQREIARTAPVQQETLHRPETPSSSPLPREKLEQLAELVSRLPIRQQDVILTGMPLAHQMRDVVAAALAPFPEALAAVSGALRAVEV